MKSSLLFLLLAVREIAVTTGDSISAQCRDRFLEPFSSDSIWNTAIGSAASFAAANLYADAATNPLENVHNDQDFFLRVTNDDPIASWVSQGDWGGDDHCAVTGDAAAEIPLPADWTTASDCAGAAFPDECRSPPASRTTTPWASCYRTTRRSCRCSPPTAAPPPRRCSPGSGTTPTAARSSSPT